MIPQLTKLGSASQAWQTSPRAFQYLAAVSTGTVALSMVLAILYLKDRLIGFDELDWLGNERWYLFGLFAWSLLTNAFIGLAGLAMAERDRLAATAAERRLAEARRMEEK